MEKIQSTLKIFINEVQNKSNRTPIIYTDLDIGNKYLRNSYFPDYPLWVANYTRKKIPI
jgi:lysozyme